MSNELPPLPDFIPPPPDSTGEVEETAESVLAKGQKPGWKPDISMLPDAIVAGRLCVGVGEKLLVQYPQPWRDTTVYVVKAIDPEGASLSDGYVRLWDPLKMQYAGTDYVKGPMRGLTFKVPDPKRRYVQGLEVKPTKVIIETDSDGNPIAKRRGRPVGSKNRK